MNIAQIENNIQKMMNSFTEDTFIYELLLSYGLPKASITRLQKGNLNLSKNKGEITWKKKLFFKEIKKEDEDLHETIDSLQKDTQNHLYKNEILDEIERNPELIDKLSYERLVKLNQLYDEKITELERLSLNVDINKK